MTSPEPEPAVIVPYQDGPYLVRGPFVVQDQSGEEIVLRRRTIALCRCGRSRMRPLCDGTHRAVNFGAPSTPEEWPGPAEAEPASGEPWPGRDPDMLEAGAGAPPTLAGRALTAALRARCCLANSVKAPCPPFEDAAMRLAEPLVSAAVELLLWRTETSRRECDIDNVPSGGGAQAAGALIRSAVDAASDLHEDEPGRETKQIVSLLDDAAASLEVRDSLLSGGDDDRDR